MDTQIRKASASDVEALIALSRRTISTCYRPFLGDEAVNAFIGSGAVDQYVKENLGGCTVVVGDGEVVGYSICRSNVIDLMMIDQQFHRQGLGSKLIAHIEHASFDKFNELILESFEGNENANAFYRVHGWFEASRYLDESLGVNKIVFRKTADRTP